MRNSAASSGAGRHKRSEPNPIELEAETDVLGDNSDDSSSTDGIPENFMGEISVPDFDGSEPPLSQPVPELGDVQANGSKALKGVCL